MTLTPNQKAARGQFLQKWYNAIAVSHGPDEARYRITKAMLDPKFLSQFNGLIASTTPATEVTCSPK